MNSDIIDEMQRYADVGYKEFNSRLLPTVPQSAIIGVRMPKLRAMAKRIAKEDKEELLSAFYADLPHTYHEENLLHAILISGEKNFKKALELTNEFLPYIDNWSVADIMTPKAFGKNKRELVCHALKWLDSPHTYTARVGVNMLRQYFLDDGFEVEYFSRALEADRDDYYVSMAVAWYFCDALIKRYAPALEFLGANEILPKTRRMLLGKVGDTFRLSPEQKAEITKILSIKHDT